jgi:hypothetical protein
MIAGALFVATAAVAVPVSNDQTGLAFTSAIRTYLQPDLSFKSVISSGPLTTVAGPIGPHRSCRCGCGGFCQTDADCGPGGHCDPFPTCCAKQPGKDWPQEAEATSSRIGDAPAVNIKCK